jgi:hypothetical protein
MENRIFDLGQQTISVVVEDDTRGGDKSLRLRHTFRVPTDKEWMVYQRAASAVRLDGPGAVVLADPVEAQVQLWSSCIESVDEDYHWQGAPVMQQPDWKDKIPAVHKALAVRTLVSIRAKVLDGPLA